MDRKRLLSGFALAAVLVHCLAWFFFRGPINWPWLLSGLQSGIRAGTVITVFTYTADVSLMVTLVLLGIAAVLPSDSGSRSHDWS